jgi:hypothetical protein
MAIAPLTGLKGLDTSLPEEFDRVVDAGIERRVVGHAA